MSLRPTSLGGRRFETRSVQTSEDLVLPLQKALNPALGAGRPSLSACSH